MMRHDIAERTSRYIKGHRREHRRHSFLRGISALVVFCTVYSLILPAISMEQKLSCGRTEHRHSESCYESRLICGDTETEPIETLPEAAGEAASAEAHVHTDACYERVLTCEEEEHTHSLSCFADPDADVESADVWARSVADVTLSKNWAEDVAAIAESQIGYRESEKNYQAAWDGITKNGYTRYGAWYGEPYADWSALFAAFCLHYAGVSKEAVPHAATCAEWLPMLSKNGYDLYIPAGDGAPVRGDLLFLDLDADETADHAAIVTESRDGKLKAVVGDLEGKVQLVTYPADDARILGFAKLPENPDANSPEATAPDVNAPEATAPEADIPEATVPEQPLPAGETALSENSLYNKAALLALAAKAEAGTLQNEINQIAALANPVGTVTLNRDYTENLTIPDNTDITLDLNGHTLAPVQRADSGLQNHITVYGTLTVTDSTANGKLANSAGYGNIRAITVASGARLTMLGGTVSGYGVSGNGAGVRVEANGQFAMQGGTIAGNTADIYGGGIYTYDIAQLTLTGGTLSGNRAEYGGGVASYHSTTTADTPFRMENMALTGNRATYGGGFYVREDIHIELESVTITGNRAEESGGGLYFESYASLSMGAGSAISNNDAVKNGGGVYFTSSTTRAASDFTMTGGEIRGNSAGYLGGGVGYAESPVPKTGGVVRISGGVIADNVSNDRGGGLYLPEKTEFVLSGGEIVGNHAATHGGGFYLRSNGSFTMTGGAVRGNVLDSRTVVTCGAGGLLNGRNVVTLSGGSISENTGAVYGGGLCIYDGSTITIEGNVEIARNTVDSATATCKGAGLYTDLGCRFIMTGGSITENHSNSSVEGVGLYLLRDGSYSITGGKITNNTASGGNTMNGGGIHMFDHIGKTVLTVGGTAEISGNSLKGSGITYGGGISSGGTVILCGNAVVRNNSSTIGGGVNADALALSENAVITQNTVSSQGGGARIKNFHMTGGSITENHAGTGGGVYLDRYRAKGSANEITGGEISGNSAKEAGGGIYLYGHYATPETGIALQMTGGSITDNRAKTSGGGIYVTHGARLLLAGGSITANNAEEHGGGICVSSYGQHIFADEPENTSAYSLELKAGSTLSGNNAGVQGRDLYVGATYAGGIWKQPYFHVDAAETLGGDGSAWHDEAAHTVCDGELDNRAEIQQMEQSGKYENRSYAYTFVKHTAGAAQVESTVYPTVQSAVDAIAAGTHGDPVITMLADSREDVTVPENLTVTLDLAGYTLSGLAGSVITVKTGADFTIRDTSAAQTGTVTQGRGTPTGTGTDTLGGGVYVESSAHLTVEGGTFRENTATRGSAVCIRAGADVTMTGGSITENGGKDSAIAVGLGISETNIRFTMTGGSVTNNGTNGIWACGTGTVVTISGTAEAPVTVSGNKGRGIMLYHYVHLDASYLTLTGNTTTQPGGGLYLHEVSEAVLRNCTVSGNRGGSGGGIYVYPSSGTSLYLLHGMRVWGNTAETASADLHLGANSYFYGEKTTMGTADDTRAAKSMALPDGLRYWYDAQNGCYYVENGNTESQGWGVPVKTVGFGGDAATSMVKENNQLPRTAYLTACAVPAAVAVARIGEREYPTLAAAILAAESSGEAAVTVTLLRDVTESVILRGGADAPAITIDLNGHTVSASASARQVLNLYPGSSLTLMDSSAEQTGALLPGAAENVRAIYLNGAAFTLQSGTLRGFSNSGDGGAIYAAQGTGTFGSHVTIAGGVIEDCTADEGGAVYMFAAANTDVYQNSFTMTGGTIRNCTARRGGGIYLHYDYSFATANHLVRISGGTIDGCRASQYGGGIYYRGNANPGADTEIYGITIQNCTAETHGGGIYTEYAGTEARPFRLGSAAAPTQILNNRSAREAGGVYLVAGYAHSRIVITNVTVSGNRAGTSYGGVRAYCADMTVDGLTVTGNEAVGAAGAYLCAARLNLSNSTFTGNLATGGGLSLASNALALPADVADDYALRMAHCTVSGNWAHYGGGMQISSQNDVELTDVTVTDNTAGGHGGGIAIYQGSTTAHPTITLKDCHITGNAAAQYGGGIGSVNAYHYHLVLEDTEVSGNRSATGGGVFVDPWGYPWSNPSECSVTLRAGTRITGNIATTTADGGGGIYARNMPLTIEDGVEITGNSSKGGGGGIYFVSAEGSNLLEEDFVLTMTGGLIANNTAAYGGGIRLHQGTHCKNLSTVITGGRIENNEATVAGGGIYAASAAGAANAGGFLSVPVTVGGDAVITGNTSSMHGGGVYLNNYCSVTLADNARITGNTAAQYGGGVCQEYSNTRVEQTGGLLYGNAALLGQDLYTVYNATYRSANVRLRNVAEMSGDEIRATGWLDENTNRVYQDQPVNLEPATKNYPLTLLYATGSVSAIVENTDGSYTAYDLVQEAINAVADNPAETTGNVILVNDSVESVTVPAGADIKLNLNGYTLTGNGNSAVTAQGALTIADRKDTASYTAVHAQTGESAVYAPKTGATGTITGHAYQAGGGVYVDGGAVTMTGGRIAGCVAGTNTANASYGGGAVCVYAGSFTLAGGELSKNTARYGAAVLVSTASAKFIMSGGAITNNTASATGVDTPNGSGAIFNNGGTVAIYGGTISGNKAESGGAIYNSSNGTTTISGNGTVIRGNTAVYRGGAVIVNTGTVSITGASVLENRTTAPMSTDVNSGNGYTYSAGGAVYVYDGRLNVSGDVRIAGNRAVRGGGIAQLHGTVNILGGTITGNTATFGGGIAQNPLPGNNSTWMHIMGGKIYGNTATREIGNDIYSAYEGTANYQIQYVNKSLVPHMSILAASGMGLDAYNVWKDDFYQGDDRTGQYIDQGQYITASVMDSNNLALTADYFDTEIKTLLDPNFFVQSIKIHEETVEGTENTKIVGITDGSRNFDDGGKYNNILYDDAREEEVFAKELLERGEAEISDQTYVINGRDYFYISYGGKLYEQNQAVRWSSGNDAGSSNRILRSYDTVTYSLDMGIEYDGNFQVDEPKSYQLRFRATLPCGANQATFANITSLGLDGYAITTQIGSDGQECQILEGYWNNTTTNATGSLNKPLSISVYGMENGATIKPTFEAYVLGNENNQNQPAACASEILTISAAPSYNVVMDYNNSLTYTGYFDIKNGVEITEETYKAAKETGEADGLIYGTIQGVGVTLELYNDPTGKGLKGIELPGRSIQFDLRFRGRAYMGGQLLTDGMAAPYIWACKSNDSGYQGAALGGTVRDRNMNWNDVDDLNQTTHYAYNAAPYNTGAGASACYNGGVWTFTGSQPVAEAEETLIHAAVTGYSFDTTTNPTHNSDGKEDPALRLQAVKAFSAGYVQILFPLDEEKLSNSAGGASGYVEIAMDAAVSGLEAKSLSGEKPKREKASDLSEDAWKRQLDSLNGYFGREDSGALETEGIAKNETRYADNFVSRSTGLYIFNGGGPGSGDGIWKENHFDGETGGRLTNDAGTGETPIGSTVYVEGFVSYSSSPIDASKAAKPKEEGGDPLYNAEFWNVNGIEYDYMTAVNILQKFDASVYTPVGTGEVVNEHYTYGTDGANGILGGAFKINSTETTTNWGWSTSAKDATRSCDMTILYAAKPDGTNWTYQTAEGNEWDDGGVADMDQYREENLLYFKTLDDLYAYFETKGTTGTCVAILYQLRNCCIRTGRSLSAVAKMKVTENLPMTGDTYCTTNDVRAWTTYRPHYKLYSAMNGTALPDIAPTNPEDGQYHLTDLTYQFNWANVPYDGNAYGAALDPGTVYVQTKDGDTVVENADYNDMRGGNVKARPSKFEDGYIKTEYAGGNKVGGTHTGALSGNTLLLYTLDTSISIGIQTRSTGSNAAKTEYTITNGEREVEYMVQPSIQIASGAKKVELVTNGSQKTVITIALNLPEGLTYEEGSIVFDYSDKKTCQYNLGDLPWTVDTTDPRRILLRTPVSDIDKGLPKFSFKCRIGNAEDASKDIQVSGTSLPVDVSIQAIYEEHSLIAAQTHRDTVTIRAVLEAKNGIFKDVGNPLLEVGEDIVYTLTYADATDGDTSKVELVDVLPYNGDSRNTSFTGGYRIKAITLHFTGEGGADSYRSFMDEGKDAFLAFGKERHQRAGGNIPSEKALLEKLKDSCTVFEKTGDETTQTVTFAVRDDEPLMTQRAEEKQGIVLYGHLPNVQSKSRFTVTVTLSPMESDGENMLLTDTSGNTQSGGQTYGNDFFYQQDSFDPGRSNIVQAQTVNRVISGTVWWDNDRDGLIDQQSERYLQNVDAYLYQAKLDANGCPIPGEPAVDILGRQIPKGVTDKNGNYRFENLPKGVYLVVFRDETSDYTPVDKANTPFGHLTVTNLKHSLTVSGNKSVSVPIPETPFWMTEARLYTAVTLPEKDQIPSGTYTSANWNLGVYSAYGPELPKTGGIGTTSYTAGGALLMLGAGLLLLYRGKKRRKAACRIS